MVQTNLNYFSTANCLVTFQEQSTICYKTLKVIVYITSKCLFVSNKAIFAYILRASVYLSPTKQFSHIYLVKFWWKKFYPRPSLRFDSGWMIYWQEVNKINSTFCLIIHYMYVRLLPLIIGDFYLIMHNRKYNDILLTRLLVVNVWHKHHVFLLVVDIKDWLLFSIVEGFQLLWYFLSISFMVPTVKIFFSKSHSAKRHGCKVPVKQNIATLDATVIGNLVD